MGNCLRHQSSTTLFSDDDEWDEDASGSGNSFESSSTNNDNNGKTTTSSTRTATHEVKIKITKKQLTELLGKVDVKELRVEQVLAHLMAQHHHHHSHHATPWRPALQSIPEVN